MNEQIKFYITSYARLVSEINSGKERTFEAVLKQYDELSLWHKLVADLFQEVEELRSCHQDGQELLWELQDAKRAIEAIQKGTSVSLKDYLKELKQ